MASSSHPLQTTEKENSLLEKVLKAFPSADLTEDDLIQNPQFCKLLAKLSSHVDSTGLTESLRKELEKAEEELQTETKRWMRPMIIHQLLEEMVQEYIVGKYRCTVTPDDDKFYGTLEQCLLAAKCDVQLHLTEGPSAVLGISSKHIQRILPSEQDVQDMEERLPKELEKHLKRKAFSILSYIQPESEKDSDGLKLEKFNHLPQLLKEERNRIEHLREANAEMAFRLTRQTHSYLNDLLEHMRLLQTLLLENRLKVQTKLDRKKLEYLEAKCQLGVQKIRVEMLAIQLDTYTASKIATHKKIREHLETELTATQKEKQAVENKLASYDMFGQEFKDLVEEYARLQVEIEAKKLAVDTLTKPEVK
ncbi:HAUS augmin-like complex subunit 4 [Clupea harengus]|uniref:HAUS augmin-like complex subunit 4 n=1 Tax=Clupea harengus TaxID=7950 RepID=A0A6P3W2M1_CLUHA|nr:HAUS augmin-like complex subunit 4 [Clupea harengus]